MRLPAREPAAAPGGTLAIGNDVVDLGDAETRLDGLHPRFGERVFSPAERAAIAAAGAAAVAGGEPATAGSGAAAAAGAVGRARIPTAAARARLFWALWAAKESAYKALKQLDPSIVFSPRELAVELDAGALLRGGRACGSVRGGTTVLRLDVTSDGDRLHAIALATEGGRGESCGPFPPASVAVLSRVAACDDHGPTEQDHRSRVCGGHGPATVGDDSRAVRELATDAIAAALGLEASELAISGRPPCVVRAGVRLPLAVSLSHHGRFVAFAAALPTPAGSASRQPVPACRPIDPGHFAGSAPFVRVAIA